MSPRGSKNKMVRGFHRLASFTKDTIDKGIAKTKELAMGAEEESQSEPSTPETPKITRLSFDPTLLYPVPAPDSTFSKAYQMVTRDTRRVRRASQVPGVGDAALVDSINTQNIFDEPQRKLIKDIARCINRRGIPMAECVKLAESSHGYKWPKAFMFTKFTHAAALGAGFTARDSGVDQDTLDELDKIVEQRLELLQGRVMGIATEVAEQGRQIRYDVVLFRLADNPKCTDLAKSDFVILMARTGKRTNYRIRLISAEAAQEQGVRRDDERVLWEVEQIRTKGFFKLHSNPNEMATRASALIVPSV